MKMMLILVCKYVGWEDRLQDNKASSMSNQTLIHSEALHRLASNLWWSWQGGGETLWSRLDPELWAQANTARKRS